MQRKANKTYQDWCVDTLLTILKSRARYRGHEQDQGYIYVIKAIINHYASMYYCGGQTRMMRNGDKEHLNLWWDHLNETNRKEFFSPLLMSKEALNIVNLKCSLKEIKNKLHLEHITPCGYIYNRLCNYGSGITRNDIKYELRFDRLVLLKKDEAKLLDGAGQKFSQKDVDFVCRHFPETAKLEHKNMLKLVKDKKRSKDSGHALLRMAKLVNFGVSFVYNDGTPCPPKEWMKYFTNTKFTITK